MASIADTLSRKMKLPPTVRPPANPQFSYEPLAGQLYPGAQDQTDAQLLAPPYQPPERRAADQAHMQATDLALERARTLPKRAVGGAVDIAKGIYGNQSRIAEDVLGIRRGVTAGQPLKEGYEAYGIQPGMDPQEMSDRSVKAVADLMGVGAATTGPRAITSLDPNVVRSFFGKDNPIANPIDVRNAEDMLRGKASWYDTHDQTGFFPGKDEMLRGSIRDADAKINMPMLMPGEKAELKFSDITGPKDHPEFYAAYPNVGDTPVHFRPMGKTKGGYYARDDVGQTRHIGINSELDPLQQEEVFKHEGFGHVPQDLSGFSRGTSSRYSETDPNMHRLMMALQDESFNKFKPLNMPFLERKVASQVYPRTAGEVEADVVEQMWDLPYSDWLRTRPWELERFPRSEQYVRWGGPAPRTPPSSLARRPGTLSLPDKLQTLFNKQGKP